MEVARNLQELEVLAGAWQSLESAMPLATLQHAWVTAAVEAYGEHRGPRVLLAYRGTALVGIAPLWQSCRHDGRLVLIGSEELDEPMDIIAADAEAHAALVDGMLKARIPLTFQRLHWSGRTARMLRGAADLRTLVVPRASTPLPWVELGPEWADPAARLTARRRSDLRRAARRADQMGATEFEVLAPGRDEASPLVEEALRVEACSWKGRAGTALLCDAPRGAFYRAFTRRSAERGHLRISFLRVGGRPAAMQIGVEFNSRYWTYKIGYDEHFSRISPGVLLMCHMIGWSARRGLRGYEMLGQREDWLRVWTTAEHPAETVYCYPATPRGTQALAADITVLGRRRLVQAWTARYRRSVVAGGMQEDRG